MWTQCVTYLHRIKVPYIVPLKETFENFQYMPEVEEINRYYMSKI